jgi:hypothetical protein
MPDVEIGSVGSVDMLPDPLVKSVDLTPQTPPQTPTRIGIFSMVS